jgi:hypothetical protein
LDVDALSFTKLALSCQNLPSPLLPHFPGNVPRLSRITKNSKRAFVSALVHGSDFEPTTPAFSGSTVGNNCFAALAFLSLFTSGVKPVGECSSLLFSRASSSHLERAEVGDSAIRGCLTYGRQVHSMKFVR